MELIDQEHFGLALCMASEGLFCDSEVLAAPVISGTSRFVKPSFSFLVSPFESSLSDVSGGLVADGVADDLGVEVAVIVKPSFPFLVSPFESSLSDVSGGLVADGVAVEVAATAMGEDFGNEHRDLSSW
jgi:hypothetical protein